MLCKGFYFSIFIAVEQFQIYPLILYYACRALIIRRFLYVFILEKFMPFPQCFLCGSSTRYMLETPNWSSIFLNCFFIIMFSPLSHCNRIWVNSSILFHFINSLTTISPIKVLTKYFISRILFFKCLFSFLLFLIS